MSVFQDHAVQIQEMYTHCIFLSVTTYSPQVVLSATMHIVRTIAKKYKNGRLKIGLNADRKEVRSIYLSLLTVHCGTRSHFNLQDIKYLLLPFILVPMSVEMLRIKLHQKYFYFNLQVVPNCFTFLPKLEKMNIIKAILFLSCLENLIP